MTTTSTSSNLRLVGPSTRRTHYFHKPRFVEAGNETELQQKRSQRRFGMAGPTVRAGAAALLALLTTQLTCCVRCADTSKPSNMVLIVADDQDVVLGGMVSGSS